MRFFLMFFSQQLSSEAISNAKHRSEAAEAKLSPKHEVEQNCKNAKHRSVVKQRSADAKCPVQGHRGGMVLYQGAAWRGPATIHVQKNK